MSTTLYSYPYDLRFHQTDSYQILTKSFFSRDFSADSTSGDYIICEKLKVDDYSHFFNIIF